ncbi:MAG: flavin reductase family protein [Henriciella sp.]|jgi:flavin reductase (DIM6/NTAB) family NADH-FMN oxidoreductase RutF
MHFATSEISRALAYKLLVSTIIPRPIAFVTSQSAGGVLNAAPYSFFNGMGSAPPVVAIGFEPTAEGGLKDTSSNILETGEFVVNIVDEAMSVQMNQAAATLSPDIDEIALTGLETATSIEVAPPRIKNTPMAMECKLLDKTELAGGGVIIIGEVMHFHLRDEAVAGHDPLRIDIDQLAPIARLNGPHYARITDKFSIKRPE